MATTHTYTKNNKERNMLRKSGGRRCILVIATKVAIKEPLVGGSIQNIALKTKCHCMNQMKQLFDKQKHHKEATHSQR